MLTSEVPQSGAGWSSPVARWAHNPKVAGSNPAPATNFSSFASSAQHATAPPRSALAREGGGQLVVGAGLGEQRVGLGLERLHGVSTGCEADRWLLERSERHNRFGELGGIPTLLPIHALPGSDDLPGSLGVVVN